MTGAGSARPLVSVVMIAYNVERYIAQALDSVLNQSLDGELEIVVGEDRSTDGTREILLAYGRRHPQRIRPLLRERNLGMNRNFVETLLAARGEYIALLDGDDYWTTPDKLQTQVDYLRTHRECSACFHNATVVYENGQPSHPFHMVQPTFLLSHHVPKPMSTIADLAGGNFMQTCSVVFRAGLYGRLPAWYLSMPTFDWPLHLLNAEHGPIGYIDRVMGVYRVHEGSFWSTNMVFYRSIADVEAMIGAYRTVNAYTQYRYDERIKGQLLPLYNRAAEVLIERGEYGRAARYAVAALRPGPGWQVDRKRSVKLLLTSLKQAVMG